MKKLIKILPLFLVFMFACAHGNNTRKYSQELQIYKNIEATIVLDPGHGGKDSGAVGASGLQEKNLTLDIAKRIKSLINRIAPKVKVLLTRSTDIYVGLEDRIKIANNANAQLFISIHINSSETNQSSGFEVYSLDVANNRHAEKLAARENKSFLNEKNKVKFILADLRANSNRKESDVLAKEILTGVGLQMNKSRLSSNNNRGYNQALFHVLFVKMPAVLTELFFISNPNEERHLQKSHFRQSCAKGVALGIIKYLKTKIRKA